MIHVPFDEIDKTTIQELVANEVPESKTLEYKRDLKIQTKGDKKEFVADVSAFANASGGHLVFGVDEDDEGSPVSALGVECKNPDETIRQMESIVRDTIAPRIPGVRTKAIPGFERGSVIVMEIPKSWAGPHLSIKNASRFFSRHSKGKYPLEIHEIRDAFAESTDLARRISEFRTERVAKILADEGPVRLTKRPKTILHLMPFSALDFRSSIDMDILQKAVQDLPLFDYGGYDERFNLDGRVLYRKSADERICWGYLQIHRSSVIEAVDSFHLSPRPIPNGLGSGKGGIQLLYPRKIEDCLITLVDRCIDAMKFIGVSPPLAILLTLTDVKGAYLLKKGETPGEIPFSYDMYHIDRDILLLPEVIIHDFKEDATTFLRPIFDAMWQASGNSRCPHYDEEGKRLP